MSREHSLGPSTRRILQALCDRLFDPGRDDRTTPADIGLADLVSHSLALLPAGTSRGMGLLLHTLNWMPLVLIGRVGRLVALDVEDQRRFVEALAHHWFRPLQTALFAIKMLASMHYWQHPRVLAEIGLGELDLIDEDVACLDTLPREGVA